jgi:hypothetical protein
MYNLRFHILTHGHAFDIRGRQSIIPTIHPAPFEPQNLHEGAS